MGDEIIISKDPTNKNSLIIALIIPQVHYSACREYPVTCDRCYARVKKNSLEDHLTNHCTYVVCMCGQQVGLL